MFISSAALSEALVLPFGNGSRNLKIWEMKRFAEYPSGRRSSVESKQKQQRTVRYLFNFFFYHFFWLNTATLTLSPEQTSEWQLNTHKYPGSKEEGGLLCARGGRVAR